MKSGEVKVQGGVRRSEPVNLRLGFCDEDVGYSIDIGLPPPQKPPPDPPSKFELILKSSVRPSLLPPCTGQVVRWSSDAMHSSESAKRAVNGPP